MQVTTEERAALCSIAAPRLTFAGFDHIDDAVDELSRTPCVLAEFLADAIKPMTGGDVVTYSTIRASAAFDSALTFPGALLVLKKISKW